MKRSEEKRGLGGDEGECVGVGGVGVLKWGDEGWREQSGCRLLHHVVSKLVSDLF